MHAKRALSQIAHAHLLSLLMRARWHCFTMKSSVQAVLHCLKTLSAPISLADCFCLEPAIPSHAETAMKENFLYWIRVVILSAILLFILVNCTAWAHPVSSDPLYPTSSEAGQLQAARNEAALGQRARCTNCQPAEGLAGSST
jgi:hypothetical protein